MKDIVLVAFMVELVTNSQYLWRCIFFLIVIRKNKQVKLSTIKDVVKHYLFVGVGGGGYKNDWKFIRNASNKDAWIWNRLYRVRSGKKVVVPEEVREKYSFQEKNQGKFVLFAEKSREFFQTVSLNPVELKMFEYSYVPDCWGGGWNKWGG